MSQEKYNIKEKARAFTVSEVGASQLEHILTMLSSGSNPIDLNDEFVKELAEMFDPDLLKKYINENKKKLENMVKAACYVPPKRSKPKVMNTSQLLNACKMKKASGQKTTDTAES
ncbi:uncharacterized protein LOC105840732 [Monomorium pharaonis]|uniref:uncharacterized protein LOC105840732 n=1 Tax=Monomorium pharaonis TaxID=307658 RepID=UPI00063FD25E|nr:uncharacterized protein LOC105840732 [Monomorium pharaonis]